MRDDPTLISKRYYSSEELDRTTYPTSDWWEVRQGAVHLNRMPRDGEALPEVETIPEQPVRRVGGGSILPVIAPDGRYLSFGLGLE